MPFQKRALLIGSSFNGLPGTDSDVETMAQTLTLYGFPTDGMKKLCHTYATRENIITEWEKLAEKSNKGDTVVIYYSGHGGLAQTEKQENGRPKLLQFLVPYDFDDSLKTWNGIMDFEISDLLRKTTSRTTNVTYILDCCHAHRLGRVHRHAHPKALSQSDYTKIWNHVERISEYKRLLAAQFQSNPHVVRIGAAGDRQTAWQYPDSHGHYAGLLTTVLYQVMSALHGNDQFSWRSLIHWAAELMKAKEGCEPQNPNSDGADMRVPFQLVTCRQREFFVRMSAKYGIIEGGRAHGIRPGDSYHLLSFQEGEVTKDHLVRTSVPTLTVNRVFAFQARTAKKEFSSPALAIPFQRASRWPVWVDEGISDIATFVDKSLFFERCKTGQDPIVEFKLDRQYHDVLLYAGGVEADWEWFGEGRDGENLLAAERLMASAERLGQAHDLLSLQPGTHTESLSCDVLIQFSKDDGEGGKTLLFSGTSFGENDPIQLTEEDEIMFDIENRGQSSVFVHVLNVSATGEISLTSDERAEGIHIGANQSEQVSRGPEDGIPMCWSEPVPREGKVRETFVFIITSEGIDLRLLENGDAHERIGRGAGKASWKDVIQYHVEKIPYELKSSAPQTLVSELRQPEQEIARISAEDKSLFGGISRSFKTKWNEIIVVNESDKDITVVVSHYDRRSRLKGMNLEGAPTGGGFGFEREFFEHDATTKRLPPNSQGTFPLWKMKMDFGIITIYGPDGSLLIGSGRVPALSTAYYTGAPDLRIKSELLSTN